VARSQFASFIGATPDEVAIIPYASAGINSIASALTEKTENTVLVGFVS
jgi:selenocysteine lyase/cysteine desulfurase